MPHFALLDDAVDNRAKLYQRHQYSQFLSPGQLHELDARLQSGWQKGWHAVLFADYEFGLPLQKLPNPTPTWLALHWFADLTEINQPEAWLQTHYPSDEPAGITTPHSDTGKAAYLEAVEAIQAAIARGDTYQINYTTRLHLQSYGHPAKLYRRLRQPVPYGVLAHLPDQAGQPQWTLCFSPELFLNIGSDGLITTEPMKGTAPILNDGHDEARAQALQADPKNRAENIMIVDLLRNDLGKIAQTGKVHAPAPFKVSRFGSVWQMTTAITAQAKPDTSVADIFQAAFPCGSITGAPKRMSMQIIGHTETAPRGLYTGSIGWLEPCLSGIGFHGCFNVVIRTLQLGNFSDGLYQGVYGVGSGIVADSIAADEYTECQWKSRFIRELAPECALFETMRVHQKSCALQTLHLARLQQSARALNLPFDSQSAATALSDYLAALPDNGLYRVKMDLSLSDGLRFSHAAHADFSTPQSALLAAEALTNHDYLRRFKTSHRARYDEGWQRAAQQDAFDSLFFNQNGHLLEGGRSNVFVRFGTQWHTPPLHLDILNGVMRQHIMQQPQLFLNTDKVAESLITREQLAAADEIRLCNALRGVFPVTLKPA